MRQPCVYSLASRRNGTLYCGATSDLPKRMYQDRKDLLQGFSSENVLKRLVWFERHETVLEAITREKRIKKWLRKWKLELIEAENPTWDDLAVSVLGFEPLPEMKSGFPRSRE